jgi:hypothetical protein
VIRSTGPHGFRQPGYYSVRRLASNANFSNPSESNMLIRSKK